MKTAGRFGSHGGAYVPEILMPALEELEAAFHSALADPSFTEELATMWRDYAGRPTPLYRCRNLTAGLAGELYLKREDLLHGGAHKTNQVLGQGLLARRMQKTRLIAETGAGQHGVATAMVGALLDLSTRIYMGAKDIERQRPNVLRMQLLGAEVIPVASGGGTLKDAIGEAMRDWTESYESTHYLLGTVAGPHPYPSLVAEFQSVIGREARAQFLQGTGRLPDAVLACVGGGSNAIGIFRAFLEDPETELVGLEPAGKGLDSGQHGATLLRGRRGILHGAETLVLQDEEGQIRATHSISAGLDYPAVGPEHVHLMQTGRARYEAVEDGEALEAFHLLARKEGILPALESAHALAGALRLLRAHRGSEPLQLLVNLSGRGDKDIENAELRRGLQP